MKTILILLLSSSFLVGQTPDVYNHMREGSTMVTFLYQCKTKLITPAIHDALALSLNSSGLKPSSDQQVQIGNYTWHFTDSTHVELFKSIDNTAALYIEQVPNQADLDEKWEVFRQMKGKYSGYESFYSAFYYLKLDTLFPVSLNATFRTGTYIINIQKRLPFHAKDMDSITDRQWKTIDEANTWCLKVIQTLYEHLLSDRDKINIPSNGRLYHRVLTPTERLAGFVDFWTEVKYNFAFFDHVPELDWDQALLEYLPRVQAPQTNAEYYKLLTEICARLNDGHTNVYLPSDLYSATYTPKVELADFDGKVYVVNTTGMYKNVLPIGSEIVKVQGETTSEYIRKNLYPYISASTQHIKQKNAVKSLLEMPADGKLRIEFVNPEGKYGNYVFSNREDDSPWIEESKPWSLVHFEMLQGNTAYLKINSFKLEEVVGEFLKWKDSISNSTKLILDLRDNGGGNSGYGYEILKYLASRPFLTSKWMTREHKAAYKAWAAFVTEPTSDKVEEEFLLTARGDYWHVAPSDTIIPYYEQHISVPVVILIGNNTASAAEDFLIAADNIGLTETVGDLTYGSTGQPLEIRLPGGGSARICTKKDTYPDGREFVGYGIKPKYLVKPGIQDALAHRDKVLEFALGLKL